MVQPADTVSDRIRIDYHRDGREDQAFREELRTALTETPRRIPSKYFYDERGSELFEAICELPEYYPTRAERAILERHAGEIVRASGCSELVELGPGAATKTRLLLDAMAEAGTLELYVPFDVSEEMVARVARRFTELYPGLRVHGVVGDFMAHLGKVPEGGCRLAAFLGGTIGNLLPEDARAFLARLARRLDPGDGLLLGTDLIKDPAVLEVAYDDAAGVTAEFNRNILRVVNRLTGGDFDPRAFRHRAFYDEALHRIEMRLVAERPQEVHLPALDLALELREGEEILTEISTKYDREKVEALLERTGFELERWYTDPDHLFALSLARRV
ncbi:MAG TPA: L-histidine N(alpha)-methyltransferase [Thermoanaerobaculia bacterium]